MTRTERELELHILAEALALMQQHGADCKGSIVLMRAMVHLLDMIDLLPDDTL